MTDSNPAAQPVNYGAPRNESGVSVVRDQFESSLIAMHVEAGMPVEDALTFLEVGVMGYTSVYTKAAWWAWQASRQAVVVELPREVDQFADDDPGRRAFSLHTNTAYRECKRAIESQGLRVGVAK